jgi:hypothetical protein
MVSGLGFMLSRGPLFTPKSEQVDFELIVIFKRGFKRGIEQKGTKRRSGVEGGSHGNLHHGQVQRIAITMFG